MNRICFLCGEGLRAGGNVLLFHRKSGFGIVVHQRDLPTAYVVSARNTDDFLVEVFNVTRSLDSVWNTWQPVSDDKLETDVAMFSVSAFAIHQRWRHFFPDLIKVTPDATWHPALTKCINYKEPPEVRDRRVRARRTSRPKVSA